MKQLKQELDIEEGISEVEDFFWADSQVVLNDISNESKRFKVFVANRVKMIRNNTNLNQWNYVRSAENPADSASRWLNTAKEAKIKQWFEGPTFLKLPKFLKLPIWTWWKSKKTSWQDLKTYQVGIRWKGLWQCFRNSKWSRNWNWMVPEIELVKQNWFAKTFELSKEKTCCTLKKIFWICESFYEKGDEI